MRLDFAGFAQRPRVSGQGVRFQSPATPTPFLHWPEAVIAPSTMRPSRLASAGVPLWVQPAWFNWTEPSAATVPYAPAGFFVGLIHLPSAIPLRTTRATGQQTGALSGTWLQSRPLYGPSWDAASFGASFAAGAG